MIRAIDVAHGPLIVVGLDAALHHAARLMDMHRVDAVVVSDDGLPVGIVTERDLVVRGLARRLSDDTPVTAVMTPDPVTVEGTADAATAYRLLRDHNVHRLPVVIGGRLVAIITLDDFAVEPGLGLTRLVHSGGQHV